MIYPQGKIIYENLNTSFTNLEELLIGLKSERHTGFVRISYWDYNGALFMDSGKLINAVAERGNERSAGLDAVSGIMEKSRQKDGTISVHSLQTELVTLLAGAANGEVIHQDLSTEFTNLTGLLEKLRADKHTGSVEVVLQGDNGIGVIFLQDGDAVTSILSTNGESFSGADMLPKVIERASIHGAIFNVYRANLSASIAEGAEVMAGFELPLLLELWGDIIASVERIADGFSKNGEFIKTFDQVRLQYAEAYPFLDPFAAEFEYQEGHIELKNTSVRQLNAGLGECLTTTITTLDAQNPKNDLMGRVKDELAPLKESRGEAIAKFKLDSILPDLLG
jgi:hypothetical protein